MANPVVGIRLSPDLIEHYDILAAQLGVERPDVMRAALETAMKANPIDDATRAAFRARPQKRKPRVTMGPDGVIKAQAVDEVTRTLEYGRAMAEARASLAADAPRAGSRKKKTERGGVETSVLRGRIRLTPPGRPATRPSARVRPDATKRHLRAV